LDPSLALADAIELIEAPVHAVVRGILRGPALAVLCAAVNRAAHRHATVVLTVPAGSAEGPATERVVLAEQHERQVARLSHWIAQVTGRPVADVAADLRSGRVLSAEQALDYGLFEQLL
jgi:ATP-dependent Clp protease protease subunit